MSLLNFWDTQRPAKRRRISQESAETNPPSPSPSAEVKMEDTEDAEHIPNSQTNFETSLPAIKTEDAIEEYEASKDVDTGLHMRLRDGVWQKGKSSIYVDAFNLALETVLVEESHLFSEAELEIFTQWQELSYESQYLYVTYTLGIDHVNI